MGALCFAIAGTSLVEALRIPWSSGLSSGNKSFVIRFFMLTVLSLIFLEKRAEGGVFFETFAFGGAVTKTWTAGDRQRTEVAADPKSDFGMLLAQGIGGSAPVRIVRLDLGVIWNLNLTDKTYVEEPITMAFQDLDLSHETEAQPGATGDEAMAAIEMKEAKGTKTLAGLSAKGMETWIGGRRQGTVWMVPLTGDLEVAQKEMIRFQQREAEVRWAGWPEKEKKALSGGEDPLGGTLLAGTMWGGMSGTFKELKENFIVGLETGDEEEGGPKDGMLLEVKTIRLEEVPADFFEVPAGFTKLTAEQAEEKMREAALNMMHEAARETP